jgi:hypothetical protein
VLFSALRANRSRLQVVLAMGSVRDHLPVPTLRSASSSERWGRRREDANLDAAVSGFARGVVVRVERFIFPKPPGGEPEREDFLPHTSGVRRERRCCNVRRHIEVQPGLPRVEAPPELVALGNRVVQRLLGFDDIVLLCG